MGVAFPMLALNCFWVCLFCFYNLREQRLFESGPGMCVNGLQEVGQSEIWLTTALSSCWLREMGLQKWDLQGLVRLPLPKGEEAAKNDMALHAAPSAPCPGCQNMTGSVDHGVKHRCCLCIGVWVMVWCSENLSVQCSGFYCQAIEVSEVLHSVMAWEGQEKLVFEDFFLTGKAGGIWNGFNSTL